MALRKPTQVLVNQTNTSVGVTSIFTYPFKIPQDVDNVVLKIPVASINGTAPTFDVWFQTTDGTISPDSSTLSYYDVANLRITSQRVNNDNAMWASIPVNGMGVRTAVLNTAVIANSVLTQGSVLTVTGSSGASTLGANQLSGLPLLSDSARLQVQIGGTVAANAGVTVQVLANSQAATA